MLERALELAERGRGTTHPNPVVGAVVARGDEVVGEGWHERKGGPHAEVVALEAAGEAARGATLYVTLEPCDHHGTTPPCVDAILAAGIAKVVVGAKDPTRDGIARLREAGVEVELAELWEARVQNEAWLTWARLRTAVRDLQGGGHARRADDRARRALGLGRGEPAARPRAAGRLGRGRGRDGNRPRRQPAARRARRRRCCASRAGSRSAAGRSRRDRSSSCSAGPLDEELERLAEEDVQSLLLEGGPTLASSFFEADLVDKLMLFVAPKISGAGPPFWTARVALTHQSARAGRRGCAPDRLCPRALSTTRTTD